MTQKAVCVIDKCGQNADRGVWWLCDDHFDELVMSKRKKFKPLEPGERAAIASRVVHPIMKRYGLVRGNDAYYPADEYLVEELFREFVTRMQQ